MRIVVHDDDDEVASPSQKNPFESFVCEDVENWAAPRFKPANGIGVKPQRLDNTYA